MSHRIAAVVWTIYTVLWVLSYTPLPTWDALWTVKALIGVSLLTALETSWSAAHAKDAAGPSPSPSTS